MDKRIKIDNEGREIVDQLEVESDNDCGTCIHRNKDQDKYPCTKCGYIDNMYEKENVMDKCVKDYITELETVNKRLHAEADIAHGETAQIKLEYDKLETERDHYKHDASYLKAELDMMRFDHDRLQKAVDLMRDALEQLHMVERCEMAYGGKKIIDDTLDKVDDLLDKENDHGRSN